MTGVTFASLTQHTTSATVATFAEHNSCRQQSCTHASLEPHAHLTSKPYRNSLVAAAAFASSPSSAYLPPAQQPGLPRRTQPAHAARSSTPLVPQSSAPPFRCMAAPCHSHSLGDGRFASQAASATVHTHGRHHRLRLCVRKTDAEPPQTTTPQHRPPEACLGSKPKSTVTGDTAASAPRTSRAPKRSAATTSAQLADDPDEFARQLQVLAAAAGGAPGQAIVTVDGFQNGGRIPPKSSIAYIRINPDLFSAEYQPARPITGGRIEIYTKPGQSKLHGALFTTQSAAFINAKDPFATSRAAIGKQRYGFELSGPIQANRSDFADRPGTSGR